MGIEKNTILYQGDSLYGPIYSVFAFNPDDIWFGIGSMIHWDGEKYWSIGTSSVFPSLVPRPFISPEVILRMNLLPAKPYWK
jgi:hypothetical protein